MTAPTVTCPVCGHQASGRLDPAWECPWSGGSWWPLFHRDDGPLAVRVARDFIQCIAERNWASGDPLPSIRERALSWHVSVTTAARAYRLVADTGLIGHWDDRGWRVLMLPVRQEPSGLPELVIRAA